MSTTAKIGTRSYEFESREDLDKAREIWNSCNDDQDDFETELEDQGIDYSIFPED